MSRAKICNRENDAKIGSIPKLSVLCGVVLCVWTVLYPAEGSAQESGRPSTMRVVLQAHQGKWVAWDGAGLRNGIFKLKAVREDYILLQWVEDKTGLFEYLVPLQSIHYIVLTNTDTLQLITLGRMR